MPRASTGFVGAIVFVALLASGVSGAEATVLKGRVSSGNQALPGLKVKLVQSRPGARSVETLGVASSGAGGKFRISYPRPNATGAQFYVTALTPPTGTVPRGRFRGSLKEASLPFGA